MFFSLPPSPSIPNSEESGILGVMPFLKEIEIIEKRKEFFQMYMLWPEISSLQLEIYS